MGKDDLHRPTIAEDVFTNLIREKTIDPAMAIAPECRAFSAFKMLVFPQGAGLGPKREVSVSSVCFRGCTEEQRPRVAVATHPGPGHELGEAVIRGQRTATGAPVQGCP